MESSKVSLFMELGGQGKSPKLFDGNEDLRALGAQLLLSEVLEYVIKGLGLKPVIDGKALSDPNDLKFESNGQAPDRIEMVDGLADVAYTMYWNSLAFGIPLEDAFDLVCENNLEKFTKLENWKGNSGKVDSKSWDLGQSVEWPEEVKEVIVIETAGAHYAVGKDSSGKVRKPKHYKSVDLKPLVQASS